MTMQSWMDDHETAKPRVHVNTPGTEIKLDWGATHLRMSVTETVDLVYDLVDALGRAAGDVMLLDRNATTADIAREIVRHEDRVRAAADVREAL